MKGEDRRRIQEGHEEEWGNEQESREERSGRRSQRRWTHDAVGHEVVPVELPAAVVLLVEVLHLRDQVLELGGQRHKHLLAAPGPRPRVQDLDVHAVGCRKARTQRSL